MSYFAHWPNLFRGNVRDYLLVTQVAERLNLGRGTVIDLIRRGKLDGHKEGTIWLVDELSVRNYARSRCRD